MYFTDLLPNESLAFILSSVYESSIVCGNNKSSCRLEGALSYSMYVDVYKYTAGDEGMLLPSISTHQGYLS